MGIAIACPSVILYIPLLCSCEYQRVVILGGRIITAKSRYYVFQCVSHSHESRKGNTSVYFGRCIFESLFEIIQICPFEVGNIFQASIRGDEFDIASDFSQQQVEICFAVGRYDLIRRNPTGQNLREPVERNIASFAVVFAVQNADQQIDDGTDDGHKACSSKETQNARKLNFVKTIV